MTKHPLLRLTEFFARAVYRVQASGVEHLPKRGEGFLLLPNHVTWIDAIVLQIACPRPIRFIVWEPIYKKPLLNPLFRFLKAIPISSRHAKDAVRAASERIQAGEIVCIFPEGELTRSGTLLRLKRGYELIARAANAPVVPVWLDQLWGSIFSFQGGKFFKKLPKKIPYPVTVAFGEPLVPEKADIATVREKLLELGERCYQQRPILQRHLAEACLRGLKKRQFDIAVIDGIDESKMSRGMILAVGIALSELFKQLPNKRIGIVLPPGRGAVLANLGAMLAGKVPVNLNFTAGTAANQAAMRIAKIEHVITAGPAMKRLAEFPWPQNVMKIEEIIPKLRRRIIVWRLRAILLPWRALARKLEIPSRGDHDEAVILFTSGSAGDPKGVVLSHRNILGNVSQFALMLNLTREDSVLGCLPFFHSFGCTVTLWYPLIEGVRLVTYPNPLDIQKNAEMIARHRVTLLLSTPTFLRGYLRKAEPSQLASVQLTVTGAEKLPNELAQAFETRFGKKVEQGYGLTETAPVVSVNLPEPTAKDEGGRMKDEKNQSAAPQQNQQEISGEAGTKTSSFIPHPSSFPVQPSARLGSVGKLAPGLAAQIRDPDSGAPLSLHDVGMLWLRGPNIFEGYLDDPKRTADVLQNGWFKTGDLARFDEDGFLYIEGRLSRFSKIGGEMVPHETVETKIREALALSSDERAIAITGIPDEAKGEALVLLTTLDIQSGNLRAKLNAAGLPNLWIPKKIVRVEEIPALASGKLDLKHCRETALAAAQEKKEHATD